MSQTVYMFKCADIFKTNHLKIDTIVRKHEYEACTASCSLHEQTWKKF